MLQVFSVSLEDVYYVYIHKVTYSCYNEYVSTNTQEREMSQKVEVFHDPYAKYEIRVDGKLFRYCPTKAHVQKIFRNVLKMKWDGVLSHR